MHWRRVLSECLLATVLVALRLSPSSAFVKSEFDESRCEEVLACHRCSIDEKQDVRECAVTGKIQTLNCPLDTDAPDDMNTVTRYKSCKRTRDDEQSRFMHFQLWCLILGTVSFVWVRRFRVVYASLFEQRKLSIFPGRRSTLDGNNTGSAEMMNGGSLEMATREEVSPLTSSNLEVI